MAGVLGLIEKLPGRIENELIKILAPGEVVHIKLKGAYKEGLICTDRRVIVVKGGLMTGQTFGTNTFQLPYKNISGVEVKYHLLSGYFEISAGGVQNVAKTFYSNADNAAKSPNCVSLNSKQQRDNFQRACSFILERMASAEFQKSNVSTEKGENTEYEISISNPDLLVTLEKLAQLRDAGVLTPDEFKLKKDELLSRI